MRPLMSQRYIAIDNYTRPQFVDLLRDVPMPADDLQPAIKPLLFVVQPFRLLDLPVEIQRLIYEHLFGHWDVTLEYERLTMLRSKFRIHGVPSINILLSCQSVCRIARSIRLRCFSGRLILHSVFILLALSRQDRFQWLRDNVRILHFSDSSIHPERWNRYYDSFRMLRKLEIDFPNVIPLDCAKLEDILLGKEDEVLVASLDAFRLALVETVSGGNVEVVVSQKYRPRDALDRWTGAVNVMIRLGDVSGAEVIKRSYRPDDERAEEGSSKRPAELTRANGNILDAGSHRSIWEYWQAMNTR